MSGKRQAFVEKIKGNIDEWNVEIGKFRNKVYPERLMAQVQYHNQIHELGEKRRLIEREIAQLQESDEKALQGVKVGVEMAWKALAGSMV